MGRLLAAYSRLVLGRGRGGKITMVCTWFYGTAPDALLVNIFGAGDVALSGASWAYSYHHGVTRDNYQRQIRRIA